MTVLWPMFRISAAALVLAMCNPGVSFAQTSPQVQCIPHHLVAGYLGKNHGEELIGRGVGDDARHVIELFVNAETQTWTIMGTMPTGVSCMLDSGNSWVAGP